MEVRANTAGPRPLVGVTGCSKFVERHTYFVAGEKYVRAVADGAGAVPVLIPPLAETLDIPDLVERLDGLLVTGSPSNVEPHHYGGAPSTPDTIVSRLTCSTARATRINATPTAKPIMIPVWSRDIW